MAFTKFQGYEAINPKTGEKTSGLVAVWESGNQPPVKYQVAVEGTSSADKIATIDSRFSSRKDALESLEVRAYPNGGQYVVPSGRTYKDL